MKKNDFDDIFDGIEDIMPPRDTKGKLTRTVTVGSDGKINYGAVRLGELISDKKYDGGLISEIQIRTWGADFDFYDEFLQYAIYYFGKTHEECQYVPFFSFTPQYGRMTRRQLDYYLYWRESLVEGKRVRADFSHILLYIYEIINLPEDILKPETGVRRLSYVWNIYRNEFPQVDKYMCEWLADYCIIHNVKLPLDLLSDFMNDIIGHTSFPEFYLDAISETLPEGRLILSYSDYDYKKSRFYTGERSEAFDRHMVCAVSCAFPQSGKERNKITVIRDSYIGALCLFQNKRRMTVSYSKITEKHIQRETVTDCVKYIENILRDGMGIHSKLKLGKLPVDVKSGVDDYFSGEIHTFRHYTGELERIADRRYEPESHGFSIDEAEKIEKHSRAAALLLEGDMMHEEESENALNGGNIKEQEPEKLIQDAKENKISQSAKEDKKAGNYTESEKRITDENEVEKGEKLSDSAAFLLGILKDKGYSAFEAYANQKGIMPEAVIEDINYYAFLTLGDIVLEQADGGYRLIEDYREDVEKWLTT